MNGSKDSINGIIEFLNKDCLNPDVEVVVAPPAIYLGYTRDKTDPSIGVSGQNCYLKPSGAFTGENSLEMIKDMNCEWVILGHSERRNIFGESDKLVADKTKFALDNGLKVIACIGEKLEERQAGKTDEVVFRQMQAILDEKLTPENWNNLVIAYEPVWAIGTGVTATPEQAQEVHENLRKWLTEKVSMDVANSLRIIYGGSVTAGNCRDLGARADIDGFLVGGASLKRDFIDIVNARS